MKGDARRSAVTVQPVALSPGPGRIAWSFRHSRVGPGVRRNQRPLMLQSYNSSLLSQLSADGPEIARGRRGAVGEAQEVITMISTRGALFALMLAALSTTGCSSPVLVVKSLRGLIPVEALRRLAIARTGYSSPPVRAPLTCQDRLRPTAPPRTTPVAHEQPLLNR